MRRWWAIACALGVACSSEPGPADSADPFDAGAAELAPLRDAAAPDTESADQGSGPDAELDRDAEPAPDAPLDDAAADGGLVVDGGIDGGPDGGGLILAAPILYPSGVTHSPITPVVADALRAIAATATRSADVFAKLGDGNTASTDFLHCFVGPDVDLAQREAALRPVLDSFLLGQAAGSTPFDRVSLSAGEAWTASGLLASAPSPLEAEVAAIDPRLALIMLGSYDLEARDIHRFGEAMLDIGDLLIAGGTIPIFTAIPPRTDDLAADRWVPRYNTVIRAVAQARQVPFIDLERELRPIPGQGLAPDGIQLAVAGGGPCDLSPAGLAGGHNVRNLETLVALGRASAVLAGAPAPDSAATSLTGSGTALAPYQITSLPFSDLRDTRSAGERRLASYTGCGADQDESGPELIYRLEVSVPTPIEAYVVSRAGSDVDLHLLSGTPDEASCAGRDDRTLTATLTPGRWYFALDTFVLDAVEQAGEYLLVVTPAQP